MESYASPASLQYFASCAKSLESLLAQELREIGAADIRQTVAGVHFSGPLETAYRAVMYSRLANRVIVTLAEQPASDARSLYQAASTVDWTAQLAANASFAIAASGSNDGLRHTQFTAQRVKDAIVDQFRERGLPRPDVEKQNPGLRIHAVLRKNRVILGVELVSGSLHRRGYRVEQGQAPMKETLAAALLMRAGWPQIMKQASPVIYDPMCGAGTLLIEAVLMALDIAPGLLREGSFSQWMHHDTSLIDKIHHEAKERCDHAKDWQGTALGSDQDLRALGMARRNAERAGVWEFIEFTSATLDEASPRHKADLLISNPPYAERLGEEVEVMQLYRELGTLIRRSADGGTAAILTARPEWGKLIGVHSHKQYALFNGQLATRLLLFQVNEQTCYRQREPVQAQPNTAEVTELTAAALDEGGQMLANRLRKNLKKFSRWARQHQVSCYRLYDADIPEYAFAIDLYTEQSGEIHAHMQEYRPPASINDADAALRRRQAVLAVQHTLSLPAQRLSIKQRERQRGKQQYQPQAQTGRDIIVQEGQARFLVNLWRYLDTGLFLDHRPIRRYIQQEAAGKDLLNLFCYTAAATVQAAVGGARRSISVDLSKTYLAWAQRNFELNQINTRDHQLITMDCLEYLKRCQERFDLIFLDPPSFSNSKSTSHVLDIQRDHATLIDLCMERLNADGLLIFSNNLRRFKLDPTLASRYDIQNYSRQSLDRDFERNPRIHHSWLIRHTKP